MALGLKAAWLHGLPEDRLWAAAAIAIAGAAGATMAVWRRREAWAFASAPAVNLAASLVVWYFQGDWFPQRNVHDWWVLLVQANIIASAAVSLVWQAARRRVQQLEGHSSDASPLLDLQTTIPVLATAVLLIPAAVMMIGFPGGYPLWTARLADSAGWLALALVTLAGGSHLRHDAPKSVIHAVGGCATAGCILFSAGLEGWLSVDWRLPWIGYHGLMAAWAAASLAMVLVLMAIERLRRSRPKLATDGEGQPVASSSPRWAGPAATWPSSEALLGWIAFLGMAALFAALVHVHHDPAGPWWTAGVATTLSLIAAILGIGRQMAEGIVVSTVLINVAGSILWLRSDERTWMGLVATNVLCLALASSIWSLVELLTPLTLPTVSPTERRRSFAHDILLAALGIMVVVTGMLMIGRLVEARVPEFDRLGWNALGMIVVALGIAIWDHRASFLWPAFYVTGLMTMGLALDRLALTPRPLALALTGSLAAFALASAGVDWLMRRGRPLWRRLHIPLRREGQLKGWFSASQLILSCLAAGLALVISVDRVFDSYPQWQGLPNRWIGPCSTLLLAIAAWLMANRPRRFGAARWQDVVMAMASLVLAESGWASLAAEMTSPWLHRSVVLMVASATTIALVRLGLSLFVAEGSDWNAAARRAIRVLAGIAAASLAMVLFQETLGFDANLGCGMNRLETILVAATLLGCGVMCMAFALKPSFDPFKLSEKERTVYVYIAFAMLAVMSIHVRMCMPWLFQNHMARKVWMLVVMGMAFAGGGLAEWFRRRGLHVLSEPFGRLALLLPLAPAIGFWLVKQKPDDPPLLGAHPLVWFLAGAFYAIQAMRQRKGWLFVPAALAANVGLWVSWNRLELSFVEHPQIWLIPLALAVLVAEYLHRDRLPASASTSLRYLGGSAIYLSSSAEFLWSLGESIWLPLALIVLSLAGIAAGVFLRVRSFLYQGMIFLMLVLVTMIRYAAVDQHQTWILYLCCIFLGAATISVVALYERHRETMLAALRRFREWRQ